ncbi:Predicted DNA-binding transcriptional regulator YafY, contains an HTH and WYL domains [Fontibacillus panacisegetis]|uniref:Predicted DNA-binding transcriptional regulator YafY, contains an HTH and WYL domains n=1 Tax=Fontibacillus panacisegetis TaxID=670482 RepID=A0A1G7L5X4_9BACL|nr:YafY family protein [Fontibacillus panacisegetis]SDF44843.1 Predicted DNA-binding transcriptional regulator YafY, contains an HTH and WYL domains [Fontibacillus panacisegetis]
MKIDRLLAMTILLLNRERVSAKELADRFEVSTKTIYRDMETLNQSGIPIVAHQGTSGGFEIMEQYTITRQYLTLNEISAVVAAVKGMNTALDDSNLDTLLEKVKALLHRVDRVDGEPKGMGMIFDFNPWSQNAPAKEKINAFRQAIEKSLRVKILYMNRNGTESERVVEPVNLILKGYVWYLQAYCTLRGDFRVFRLNRIQELTLRSEPFVRRESPSLEQYVWDLEWSREIEQEMILTFHPKVRYRIEDSFPPAVITTQEDGSIQVKGRFPIDDWFYGMLLSYGDHVKVEQPDSVAKEIVRLAQKVIERYCN